MLHQKVVHLWCKIFSGIFLELNNLSFYFSGQSYDLERIIILKLAESFKGFVGFITGSEKGTSLYNSFAKPPAKPERIEKAMLEYL